MKKILSIILALTLILALAACGTENNAQKDELYGTWQIVSVEADGSTFTLDEVEAMGDDSLSNISIVIKEGGKACLMENGDGDIVDWSKTSDGIKIGVIDCKIVDGLITIEKNGNVLSFKKVSDDQTIKKTSENTQDKNNSTDAENDTETNVEWKQFLEEYEEWVDEYIEITKKYKDNPSDISILSDYTEMMTELADWSTKTEDMEKELSNASPAELAEYSAELARIAAKIAKATY